MNNARDERALHLCFRGFQPAEVLKADAFREVQPHGYGVVG